MKRGERLMWRKLADAIEKLVESDDVAKEYMARREVEYKVEDLLSRNVFNQQVFIPRRWYESYFPTTPRERR